MAVRAKGGTDEREVGVSDIVICDIRTSPLFLPDKRWIKAVKHLRQAEHLFQTLLHRAFTSGL